MHGVCCYSEVVLLFLAASLKCALAVAPKLSLLECALAKKGGGGSRCDFRLMLTTPRRLCQSAAES
jgi:hypothetical protein